MRTAARRPPQDDAALDMIFDAGQRARDLEIVQAQLAEAKQKLAQPPLRKRVRGVVSSILVFGFTAFVFYLIGEYRAMTILSNRAAEQGLPTAGVATRTALPTPFSGLGGEPVPTSDYEAAIRAYNEQQAARAAEYAQEATQEGPSATEATPADNHEEQINAWLAAPVSTATPTRSVPEVVTNAVFDASFVDPGCSPFIGYLAGDPCIEVLKQQAGED
jgi:hypothetical protein